MGNKPSVDTALSAAMRTLSGKIYEVYSISTKGKRNFLLDLLIKLVYNIIWYNFDYQNFIVKKK